MVYHSSWHESGPVLGFATPFHLFNFNVRCDAFCAIIWRRAIHQFTNWS